MKPIIVVSLFLFGILSSCQRSTVPKTTYQHPITYQPETYICYKTNELLQIDGKLEEAIWKKAIPTKDFQDIQGNIKPLPTFQTNVKMLWDDDYFYFGAYLEEPHIWGKLTERDAVIFHDNDFEIFLDPDGDTHNYYEFEINALNTIWDLLLLRPYRDGGGPKVLNAWDIRGIKTAVSIQGTLNNPADIDSFWTIEIAIPMKVLKEMTPKYLLPKEGIQWRVNFSRVQWYTKVVDGKYEKEKDENNKNLPEENWVWSPQGYISLHKPETWGYVQFSEKIAGNGAVDFVHSPDEKIKWALRQLYYQQRSYRKKHQQYADNLKMLTLPKVAIEGYTFAPKLYKRYKGYEIIAQSVDGRKECVIRENGQILFYKK